MTAAVVATITAPQMIRGGENHQPAIKIKVAGQDFWWRNAARLGAMKFHHARPANAGFIPQIRRDLRDEFVGDFYFRAPARPFVGGDGAKLAIIRLTAEWAVSGTKCFCR
jgi:hypothetical protein